MKRISSILSLIILFAMSFVFCVGYATFVSTNSCNNSPLFQNFVTDWTFCSDSDFARIDNISNLSYLTATQETSITRGSNEAVRLTNTAGTQTKDHIFYVAFDRDYKVSEIKEMKIEFDYYFAQKREQFARGLPKVQLQYNNTGKGNTQGGGDTTNAKSVFNATVVDTNWWHLEYYITALTPYLAAHTDSPISLNQKINGIKIIDSNIYDYGGNTAFSVIDNMQFSAEPATHLGIFNKGTTMSVGGYYWYKIAWVGQLNSCTMSFSNPAIAEQDTSQTKSPFYLYGLSAGTTTVTATLDIGEDHQILSISNNITVS